MKRTAINIINTTLYLTVILTGLLTSIIPADSKELPWLSGNIFYPSEYAFVAIEILAVILLGIYTVYQFGVIGNENECTKVTDRIGIRYMVFLMGSIGWILSSYFGKVWLSAGYCAVMMMALIEINYQIKDLELARSGKASVLIFGILYGWITMQMIGEVGDVIISLSWNGFGIPIEAWLCIIVLLGSVITAMLTVSEKKAVPALTMIFLYIGLIIRHALYKGLNFEYPVAMAFMLLGIAIITLALSYTYYGKEWTPFAGRRNKNENNVQ